MPELVVHNAMGENVLKKLPPEIRSVIDYDIFRFSVMGPDPYIFYRFFYPRRMKHRINKRAKTMHKRKTGEYLLELADYCQNAEMFSFLAGFLCHYALDSTTHPFINEKANRIPGMHMSIEHKLDDFELARQGKKRKELMKYFTQYPNLPYVKKAMKDVYGWDKDHLREAYRHMKLYYWITVDQLGIVQLLFRNNNGRRSALSYRNHLSDGLDLSGFDVLEQQSEELALDLIKAAYKFRAGEIDRESLQTIIGNRSYSGGEASS